MKVWIPTAREGPGIALAFAIGLVAFLLPLVFGAGSPYISEVFLAIVLGALVRNTRLGSWFGLRRHGESPVILGANERSPMI